MLVFGLMSMIYYSQTLAWYFADWKRVQVVPVSSRHRNLKRLLISLPLIIALAVPVFRYLSRQSEMPTPTGPAQSIQLDGTEEYLTIDNIGFDATQPLTLEAWIQPDKPHRGAIVSHGPVILTVVAAGDGNRFRVHVSASEDKVYLLDAQDVIQPNRWSHVVMTSDGGEIRMYVNGRLQQHDVSVYDNLNDRVEANHSLPVPFQIADLWPGSRFLIGDIRQADEGAEFHFSGRIAEVRLSRSGFYFEEFVPEPSLSVRSDTAMLFHLRDGVETIPDATGRHVAILSRK